ncbi:MAG: alpha/beta fold hydrolase [Intrasporangium sp.]|uniref:alpha/beta fold hydrolase n=1 Tax=Intrasporangium sp. TaxID=1925024 RepID=UPI003F80D9EF
MLDAGGDGLPLLYHSGTPGGAVPWPAGIAAARSSGLRWVTYSRPGYGSSTPQPGRTVADAAADSATVLDALRVGEFVTFGWSGGGPHALSCAALLPDRCLGAATIAGAAPSLEPDLDFLAGMAEDNVEEFTLASKGREVLAPALEEMAQPYRSVTGEQLVEALGGLLSEPDLAALRGPLADYIAALAREAVRVSAEGWVEDDLAFCDPWGFDPASITVPVAVWQGRKDLMVPSSHGEWLAAHVPGARPHLLDGVGHVSLVARIGEVLDDLAEHRRR